ncbi:MAG: caspase family protein [Bacteroidetes bacterium]|nr:caspase family protein [Bacteroidota bacterium]
MKTICFIVLTFCLCDLLVGQYRVQIEPLGGVEFSGTSFVSSLHIPQENLIACLTTNTTLKLVKIAPLQEFATSPILVEKENIVCAAAIRNSLFYGCNTGTVLHVHASTLERKRYGLPGTVPITAILPIDENYLLLAQQNRQVAYFNRSIQDGFKVIHELPTVVTTLAAHPARKYVVAGTQSGELYVLSMGQFKILQIIQFQRGEITTLCFSNDGKYLVAGTSTGSIGVWDGELTTQHATILECGLSAIKNVAFDPTNTFLIGTCQNDQAIVYTLTQPALSTTIKHSKGSIIGWYFVGEETIVSVSSHGEVVQWKYVFTPQDTIAPTLVFDTVVDSSRTPIKYYGSHYTLSGLVYDNTETIKLTVNGREVPLKDIVGDKRSIPEGMVAKRFVVTVSPDSSEWSSYTFECTDAAGNSTTARVTIQWLSRENAIEIVSPAPDAETDLISVPLHFKAWFDISTYSISVNMNDVVLDQEPGFEVVNNEIRETIPLLVGYNQIRLTVKSKAGEIFSSVLGITRRAGYSQPLSSGERKPRSKESGPQRWAVVVGVSEYQNSAIPSLKYADKDAEAFANFLRRPQGGGFDSEHMRVLLNKDATLSNIKDALINFLSQAIDIDLVIIYFAGHGAPEPGRPQNMYLLTYDTDPRALGTTAFPMWDIQTVLARYITAKRVVVFTDACHSGGISVEFATRGLGITQTNLINQYLADLAKSKEGVVVFTASAAGEVSQEYPEYGHGVFTYFLLQGLEGKADYNNDYTVTINELMQYVEEQVKRKTRGAQNPTRSQTQYDKDLTMSIIPH